MTELLPCPFCGVSLIANNNQEDLYIKRYGTHYDHPEGDCFLADAELSPSMVESWNARATPAGHSAPLAKRAPATDAQIDAYAKWNAEFFETHGRIPERIEIWNAAPQPPQTETQSVRDAWISVDERLPEKNLVVLCGADFYAPGDWRMKLGYFDGPTSVWKLFSGSWTPTHWQPLPEPPQKPVEET